MIRARVNGLVATVLAIAGLAACARGPARPVTIDRANDQCASCRMVISDARTAAQVTLPGEEPRFYDDLVCLRLGLRGTAPIPEGAGVFIVDYRTGAWEPLDKALFVRLAAADTPMASHWVAYADDRSRRLDPQAAGVEALPAADFLAAEEPEEGR